MTTFSNMSGTPSIYTLPTPLADTSNRGTQTSVTLNSFTAAACLSNGSAQDVRVRIMLFIDQAPTGVLLNDAAFWQTPDGNGTAITPGFLNNITNIPNVAGNRFLELQDYLISCPTKGSYAVTFPRVTVPTGPYSTQTYTPGANNGSIAFVTANAFYLLVSYNPSVGNAQLDGSTRVTLSYTTPV